MFIRPPTREERDALLTDGAGNPTPLYSSLWRVTSDDCWNAHYGTYPTYRHEECASEICLCDCHYEEGP
jgi:hypothetical protein